MLQSRWIACLSLVVLVAPAFAVANFEADKAQIISHIPAMCVNSTEAFMPGILNVTPEAYHRLLNGSHSSVPESILTADMWDASLIPLEWVRLAAYKAQPSMLSWGISGSGGVEAAIRSNATLPMPTWNGKLDRKFHSLEEMRHIVMEDKASIVNAVSLSGQKLLCSEVTLMNASTCGNDMKKIVDWMHPTGYFSMPELLVEVSTNRSYEEGLRQAALLIMGKVDSGHSDGHLNEDLAASFRAAGIPESKIQEYTFNILGTIATAGPNIVWRMALLNIPGESEISKVAISSIAAAASVLDERSLSTGHPYSFPRELSTSCDVGKTYHFWMSAYFSWRLTRDQGNGAAARAAAFIVEKGYQMRSTAGGRLPNLAFTTPSLAMLNNRGRLDLVFAAAGASYGASVGAGKSVGPLNVDTAIRNIFEKSQDLPVLTDAEAQAAWGGSGLEGYNRWEQIFAPNTALDSFN